MIFNMVGGGGGSSTKSTIIVSIETGSTVAAYSDSSYQTLVKTASEKSTGEYWLTGLANGTYYLKATKGTDTSTLAYTIAEYGVYRISMAYRTVPEFTYTGTYELVDDNGQDISGALNTANWKIRFLTGGTLSFSNLYGAADGIDIFLVGGGGGGGTGNGGGGGGGYTATVPNQTVLTNTNYSVTIGAGGASGGQNLAGGSSAFGEFGSADGGKGGAGAGVSPSYTGGDGGSGGGSNYNKPSGSTSNGGSDGSNGYGNTSAIGKGQGTTTREFAEAGATLYAGGGGSAYGAGGDGGGADGGNGSHTSGYDAVANTGGGGGGGKDGSQFPGGAGGSGIVIIRNARS